MIISDKALLPLVGQSKEFESLMHSLLRAEAFACGIPQHQIDWDNRTYVPDGGIDILIRAGSRHTQRLFIPDVPSAWSIKSGSDGLAVATLRREISGHPSVLEHLRSGCAFCWCIAAPASAPVRTRLHKQAQSLAAQHGFASNLVRFYFSDHILWCLQSHPGLAVATLNLPSDWKTLKEWEALDPMARAVQWVDFGGRSSLITQIQQHLLGSDGENVLHIAGLSGIGKSRTALQACEHESLHGVLYFPNIRAFRGVESYLTRNAEIRAAIVIDDVELPEWSELRTGLIGYTDRLRVLTIGPAAKGSIGRRPGIIEVPAPDSVTGVVSVVQSSDPTMSEEQAANISDWSDHDLRLALLLVKAAKLDRSLTSERITSIDDVWRRIVPLFRARIADEQRFRDVFAILSICLDVGNSDGHRAELDYLSSYFSKNISQLDVTIEEACDCGLGSPHDPFFEAGPRALARRVFETIGWPLIRKNAKNFIANMPSLRLQKRLIDRAHESSSDVREDVAAALSEWFRERFPTEQLALLHGRQASRVFSVYAELNPRGGLGWLRSAVQAASPAELAAFDGHADNSGGWRGRRQIVWLCEELACFPEHFWDCEAVLYSLAQHEAEPSIANNSSGVWKGLFTPVLSGVAVPFEERLQHLLARLQRANVEGQPLVIDAILNALSASFVHSSPPRVVGGRLVPEEWRPNTLGELHSLQQDTARRAIAVMKSLPLQITPLNMVIQEIGRFLRLGCVDLLREWIQPGGLDEGMLRALRAKLDDHLHYLTLLLKDDGAREDIQAHIQEIQAWRQTMEPTSLALEIRDVTARDYWAQKRDIGDEAVDHRFNRLAAALTSTPETLDGLIQWFDSDAARSARVFGRALGTTSAWYSIKASILTLLAQGRCEQLVAGFFAGVSELLGKLPDDMWSVLDAVASPHPRISILITLYADCSRGGMQRILNVLLPAQNNTSGLLLELLRGSWPEIVTVADQVRIIQILWARAPLGDDWAIRVALDLIGSWYRETAALPEALVPAVINLLEASCQQTASFEPWHWAEAIRLIPAAWSKEKANLLAAALVRVELQDEALGLLTELAKDYPSEVISAVGARAVDPETRIAFYIGVFRGLFEAIDLDAIKQWVQREGVEAARAMARHVPSPAVGAAADTYVPRLTEWLLSEFEGDDTVFSEFCAGRHSHEVRWGSARDHLKGWDELVRPYLQYPLRRIREWARYEIEWAKARIQWDERLHSEFERG